MRAELLQKELSIFTFQDLLEHYPFRHVDRTRVQKINEINNATDFIQIAGKLLSVETLGAHRSKRLVARLKDDTGIIELTWFQGITWVQKMLETGVSYLVYGKPGFFQGQPQIIHPEIEVLTAGQQEGKSYLEPVYPTTEKLRSKGLGGRQLGKLTQQLFSQLRQQDVPDFLPSNILAAHNLLIRYDALRQIHFPESTDAFQWATKRIKYEELFIAQLRLQMICSHRHRFSHGVIFEKVGDYFNSFYKSALPFELTNAQKRVVKEIRTDTATGRQMNRLLQGDVGSGKTIVALLSMLIALDNGYQACLMAPTEILAKQHFAGISKLLKSLPINVRLLTGSTRAKERRSILETLASGELHIIIGTHAVIEDPVIFKNLGLVVIDEQHRFGVEQRARLWAKASTPPHILVMTATPIPRTLAMTAYGDLDYSVIDELPPGRKEITTVHRNESQRAAVMNFIRAEIEKGRQAYIIFPLIEESEKMDYENLMQGYENVKGYFPEPKYWISMVHGKLPSEVKDTNMKRFITGDTHILVSTTVIEVGVDVPNASVMVIESAEKFGLSQLHQLRGRVGRGAEKSYCVLLSGSKISRDAWQRLKIMEKTSNGFIIAEKDLEMRGPGEIDGTRQSGVLNFKLANIVRDRDILEASRTDATAILDADPELELEENRMLKKFLHNQKQKFAWGKIS